MIRIEDRFSGYKGIFHVFVDSWLAMLCLGGLADHLNIPQLAIAYWTTVLAVLAIQIIAPEQYTNLEVKSDDSN